MSGFLECLWLVRTGTSEPKIRLGHPLSRDIPKWEQEQECAGGMAGDRETSSPRNAPQDRRGILQVKGRAIADHITRVPEATWLKAGTDTPGSSSTGQRLM